MNPVSGAGCGRLTERGMVLEAGLPGSLAGADLDACSEYLTARIEDVLAQQLGELPDNGSRLLEAMRYAALGGGKRLRPLLTYASGSALGLELDQLDIPAMAVELIHCYSLIHDDLPAMDDDRLRRGRPTVHLAFDEATAILAGDALQALAFETLTRINQADAACTMMAILTRACGLVGMAGGQALDLHYEGKRPSQAAIEDMFARKTGALIKAAVTLPTALRPELPEAQRRALGEFADAIGLAFQIRDDLLEIEGDTQSIGKSCDSDVSRRKASWPMLFNAEAARRRIDELSSQAQARLDEIEGDTRLLAGLARRLVERTF